MVGLRALADRAGAGGARRHRARAGQARGGHRRQRRGCLPRRGGHLRGGRGGACSRTPGGRWRAAVASTCATSSPAVTSPPSATSTPCGWSTSTRTGTSRAGATAPRTPGCSGWTASSRWRSWTRTAPRRPTRAARPRRRHVHAAPRRPAGHARGWRQGPPGSATTTRSRRSRRDADGSQTVTLRTADTLWLRRLVWRLGGLGTVLDPPTSPRRYAPAPRRRSRHTGHPPDRRRVGFTRMWWWVLIWVLLVVIAAAYLATRAWGVWGQVKELNAEVGPGCADGGGAPAAGRPARRPRPCSRSSPCSVTPASCAGNAARDPRCVEGTAPRAACCDRSPAGPGA